MLPTFLILSCVTPQKVDIQVESKVLIFPVAPLFPDIQAVDMQEGSLFKYEDARKLAEFIRSYKAFYDKYQIATNYNLGGKDG